MVNTAAAVPNLTLVVPVNPLPVITTDVPALPDPGVKDVIVRRRPQHHRGAHHHRRRDQCDHEGNSLGMSSHCISLNTGKVGTSRT